MTDLTDELLAAASEKRHTPLLRTRVHPSARVTVLFAAAGFGKTYAMMDAFERARREERSVAWLTSAALAVPSGDIPHGIQRYFELFAGAETVFIDDLDVLSPEQRRVLLQAFILTAPLRKIVMATRSLDDLGLARQLAAGAVQLIQADTLRWRRRQMSELWKSRLTTKQINLIESIAQGWPAVSQLLARFVAERGDTLAGSQLLNASLVADYISTEVLANFKPNDLSLLSMTSLIETFDETIIRRFEGNSTLTCDELVRRLPGLCTYEGSGGRVAYNRALLLYLQQIFASLPETTQSQARRHAADWASEQGDVVSAVKLAARAGDRQRIVDYVAKAGGLKIQTINGYDDLRAVVIAAGETAVAEEPRLKLLKCVVLLKDGRIREAFRLYQETVPALPADTDTARDVAVVRLFLMVYGCQVVTMSDAEIALVARSFDRDPTYKDLAPTTLAIFHCQRANFGAASAAISAARALSREAGMTYNLMHLDCHSAVVALACGNLEDARKHLSKARLRWRAEYPDERGTEILMQSLGAQLAFERGNIPQAKRLIGRVAHSLAHTEAWLDIYFAGYEPMFRLLARDQGLPAAMAAIDQAQNHMQEAGLDRIATGLHNLGICLIGEEALEGVRDIPLPMDDAAQNGVSQSWQEKELELLALAYRHLANRRPGDARQVLDSLITFAEEHQLLRTKLRALLLRRVAKNLLGDSNSATEDFHAALEIGSRTGMRQAFLEFGGDLTRAQIIGGVPQQFIAFTKGITTLLAGSSSNRSKSALTRREAQILELLASGDSDKGIARTLEVTEHAVRFHLKNIYQKLSVHDRNSAIRRNRAGQNI